MLATGNRFGLSVIVDDNFLTRELDLRPTSQVMVVTCFHGWTCVRLADEVIDAGKSRHVFLFRIRAATGHKPPYLNWKHFHDRHFHLCRTPVVAMNFRRSKVELSVSAALFSVLIFHSAATAQSTDFSPEPEVGQVGNEVGETTYFDEYDTAVPVADDGEDFMDGIDQMYAALPDSERVAEAAATPRYNTAIFSLPDEERTFAILGGYSRGTDDLSDFDDLLADPSVYAHANDRTGYTISAALGRRRRAWFRTELDFSIRQNNSDVVLSNGFRQVHFEQDLRVLSLMKNAIFEWQNKSDYTPYGGVGIGGAHVDVSESVSFGGSRSSGGIDDIQFSWQAIAGLATEINETVDFVIEYRYFSTTDVTTADGFNFGPVKGQDLLLGLRFEF